MTLDGCVVSVEILFLSQSQPLSAYPEYINLCKGARNETAVHSDDKRGSDNEYEELSPAQSGQSEPPAASSKQLPLPPARSFPPSIPVKPPRLDRLNSIKDNTTKEPTSGSSSTHVPTSEQLKQTNDDLTYEFVETLPSLNVKAEGQTTTSKQGARNETAVGLLTDDKPGNDNSGSDNLYEELSPAQCDQSQPIPSSKQLPLQPARSFPPSIPVQPRLNRLNSIKDNTTKEPTSGSSSTHAPTSKQLKQTNDDLMYEIVETLRNLNVKAEGQTTTSKQESNESMKTPPSSAQANQLYAKPEKKQQPPTKPKTVNRNLALASRLSVDTTNAARRVNSVKPFVDTEMSVSSQPPTSPGHGKKYWKSAHDVPANLENLSVDQVGECMELLHLPKLAAEFRLQDVDGKLLVRIISEEILIKDFNCNQFKAKQVVQFVKNGWRPNE